MEECHEELRTVPAFGTMVATYLAMNWSLASCGAFLETLRMPSWCASWHSSGKFRKYDIKCWHLVEARSAMKCKVHVEYEWIEPVWWQQEYNIIANKVLVIPGYIYILVEEWSDVCSISKTPLWRSGPCGPKGILVCCVFLSNSFVVLAPACVVRLIIYI